jgi:hypothetical protein
MTGSGISAGPLGLANDPPADRTQWVIIERNILHWPSTITDANQGGIGYLESGLEDCVVRNNVVRNRNTRSIDCHGNDPVKSRTVQRVWILNNTFINEGINGVCLKVSTTAASVYFRNNIFIADTLTMAGDAVNIDSFDPFTAITTDNLKAINHNVWPEVLHGINTPINTPNVFKENGTRITLSAWNGRPKVGDDMQYSATFASQSAGTTYKVRSGTSPATWGVNCPGVRYIPDLYGTIRTADVIAAGAAEGAP